VWAEIGVIFLLFGLGLEFSFKKLVQVGKSASITAVFEVLFMLGLGFLVGRVLGWSQMDSLFLGGILSISSTTIIVRAFSELGMRGKRFVSLVFGVLIVEDLVAILLLVLLSTIAATRTLSGTALAVSGLRLGFFMAIWFVVGIYAVPLLLTKIRRLLTDETTLVVSLGLCLTMVLLATEAGFSPALGAFVMGSILAETTEGERIEHLLTPVRDLFGAVFFVSVGMLIDPSILREHFWTIALVTVATISGKLFSTTVGALLSGESLKTSTQAGMSLAQIGEFSFIIATLGLTLKVTSDFLYPIAVSASAITTFTTPYLIKSSGAAYERLAAILPSRIQRQLSAYQSIMSRSSEQGVFLLIWKIYGAKIFLNALIVVAITLGVKELLLPFLGTSIQSNFLLGMTSAFAALLFSAPFLLALSFGLGRKNLNTTSDEERALQKLGVGIFFLRLAIGAALVTGSVLQFQLGPIGSIVVLAAFAICALIFKRFARGLYVAVEKRFISNLREGMAEEESARPELAPWDASLAEFVLSPNSSLIAQSLEASRIKETFGVTIGMIERGNKRILAPGRYDLLLPFDRLFLIGADDQLAAAKEAIEVPGEEKVFEPVHPYGLECLKLENESPFVSKSIRECGIRERVRGLIVGIERRSQRILNPDSTLTLERGDLVWLVGDKKLIRELETEAER
jgi:CPA2 family monovalent cation:H+ antiporter-2